jgi:hypothetical protein
MNGVPCSTRLQAVTVLTACLTACGGPGPIDPADGVAEGVDVVVRAAMVQGPRPLKGSLNGTSVPGDPCSVEPLGMLVTATADGTVSHLGATTLMQTVCVSIPDFFPIGPSAALLTAANGDRLDGMLTGDLVFTPTGFDFVITITGGTGRFAQAGGQYTVHIAQAAPLEPFSATLDGWIEY